MRARERGRDGGAKNKPMSSSTWKILLHFGRRVVWVVAAWTRIIMELRFAINAFADVSVVSPFLQKYTCVCVCLLYLHRRAFSSFIILAWPMVADFFLFVSLFFFVLRCDEFGKIKLSKWERDAEEERAQRNICTRSVVHMGRVQDRMRTRNTRRKIYIERTDTIQYRIAQKYFFVFWLWSRITLCYG